MAGRAHRGQNPPPVAPPPSRQNEWFIPRDGIDREVITADICRYLGNDALVRPGTYDDRESGHLKTDSARWEQERRHASGAAQRYTNSELRTGSHAAQFEQPGSAYQINPMREPDASLYPGNDAAGYSGNDVPRSAAGFPSYGGPAGYGQQQYPPQSAAYSARPPEPRTFANPGGNGQYGQPPPSFGGHQPAMEAPYVASVNFAPQQQQQQEYGHPRGDIRMGDAPPAVNPRSSYPPTSGPSGYGNVQPGPSYNYAQSQAPTSQSMAYAPQPMDAFYGRQPFQAGSVPPPSSGPMQTDAFTSSPTGGQPMSYSPAPEYEQSLPPPSRGTTASTTTLATSGASGSSVGQRRERDNEREREREREQGRARERDRRDRDRDDREPEATRRRHR